MLDGRHHVGTPGAIKSESAGDFVGIRNLTEPDKAKTWFDALAAGGTVDMPLQKTFWASAFGMLTDRFNIPWMVNCA